MVIDVGAFRPAIIYTIYIAATPDEVWQALTSADFSRQYFHGLAVELDQKAGGAFKVLLPDGSPHITGEVIAWDPPRELVITWDVNWPGLVEALGPTLVSYVVEPAGEAVRLTVTQSHDRALSDEILSGGRTGWPVILSGLKSLLETGRVPAIDVAPPLRLLAALKAMGVEVPGT